MPDNRETKQDAASDHRTEEDAPAELVEAEGSDAEPTGAQEYERFKEQAKKYSIGDLRSGEWFAKLIAHSLRTYAEKVDAAFFETKYPGLNRDAMVERRISLAKRYAGLAGGTTAAAYSAAVASTIGTGGGSSPLTVPAAVVAFAGDLTFITWVQLRLAYDLSILYRHPIDLDDAEDMIDLIKVAFGIKAGEQMNNAVAKLAPEAVRVGVKQVIKGGVLQWLKALPIIGRYLLQRNIIKFAIPLINVPLSSGMNYWMTGSVGRTARRVYRDKAVVVEQASRLADPIDEEYILFLKTMWLVVQADGSVSAEESSLISALAKELAADEAEGARAVEAFAEMVTCEEAAVLKGLEEASQEFREAVYEAACVGVAIDHKFHRKERQLLERIAAACGTEFNEARVKDLLKEFNR